jgi:arylsulfatase A
MRKILFLLIVLILLSCISKDKNTYRIKKIAKPNIVIFYVDDLGYGDLSSYGAIGVETPNVDKLAKNGLQFTDAHSSAATCTPSRYSLLTGNYAFRNNAAILPGDAPLIISPETPTLPKALKKAGYTTAVIGKWHLGLGDGIVDWNTQVKPGPLEIGFDYSFLLPATGDRTPTVYLENYDVVNLETNDSLKISYKKPYPNVVTGIKNPEMLRQLADKQHSQAIINGVSRIGYQKGGTKAMWVDEEFPNVFTEKAVDFINKNKESPFFLFFSFHDIHVPRLPNKRFEGKSTMGPRGDAIAQMDWMTGRIVQELKKLNLEKNTLIIFTSDNGPILNDGYEDFAVEKLGKHKPGGPYRGAKYSAFEAGTRVPMITYWPGKISPGTTDALVSQTDYYASLAKMVNVKLERNEAIDSKNILLALFSKDEVARSVLLEESFTLSIRNGNMKYIQPITEKKFPKWLNNKKIETGFSREAQLYDLSKDSGEQKNIASFHKELVKELQSKLDSIVNIQIENSTD